MLVLLAAALLVGAPFSTRAAASPASADPAIDETLSGRVTNVAGEPLARARVAVSELNRSAITDEDGRFRLASLPDGTFLISVTAIGYKPFTKTVVLDGKDARLDVVLVQSFVELPAIQVTATADATAASTSPQPTSILGGDALRLAQAPTLGETLEGLAGVRNFSTGVGIGKPVVRGLTNNQVAVLANGMRLETQQWGFEHGPNIETADVERIEVIRGPGSVLYGTDAIGGVINVIAPDLPDATGGKAFGRGRVSGVYNSNNRSPEGTLQYEGASGAFGFRSSFTARDAGDTRAPNVLDPRGGELFNSGLRTYSGSATAGVRGTWGSLTATGSYRDEDLQIHEEDPAATLFQRVGDARAKLEAILPLGASRVEVMAGFQRNRRREFDDASAPNDVALGFAERNFSGHLHLHHKPIGKLKGLVGVAATQTNVQVEDGEEFIIPNSSVWNAGLFAFETIEAGRASFSFGARYDRRELTRRATPELGLVGEDRRGYNSLTGSLGAVIRTGATTSLLANLGRGFRAPTPFQLYVNGVHEGTGFFELGDSTLKTEKSTNADLALRVQSKAVSAEFGVFANFIQDNIYIAPTGATDIDANGDASPVYQTLQGAARLVGFEAAIDLHPSDWIELKATTDYVRGTNTTTDGALPFIAPFRVTYSATVHAKDGSRILKPYLTFGGESNARQDRIVDFDTPTDGYSIFHLGAGFALPTGKGLARLDLQVRNLLNEAYAPFLWRYKTYAFQMGRTLTTRFSLDF
jgi:iron complex outermembrane receptor protein